MSVATEVGIERREQSEAIVHLLVYYAPKNRSNLIGSVILTVKFKLQLSRLVALVAHELYHFIAFKWLTSGYHLLESVYGHNIAFTMQI